MKNFIAELRKSKKMTQPQLAETAGLKSYQILLTYEKGTRTPSVETALKIAHALGKTVEEVFVLEDDEN